MDAPGPMNFVMHVDLSEIQIRIFLYVMNINSKLKFMKLVIFYINTGEYCVLSSMIFLHGLKRYRYPRYKPWKARGG